MRNMSMLCLVVCLPERERHDEVGDLDYGYLKITTSTTFALMLMIS